MDHRFETLEIERAGPVLRVWLNRPARRNAVDETMIREVGELFLGLEQDFDVRVVVLGGRGPTFCAGADRKPPEHRGRETTPGDREARWIAQLGRRAARAIEDCPVPTIARIQGHAIGGGCCFALSCDFRIAERGALFRLPEVELGVPLTWAGVPRLIQEIGAARARELLLLCKDVGGETAERWGMVHRAVAAEELDAEVERFVADILDRPELAVDMTKTQLRGYSRLGALGDASEADGDLLGLARRTPESGRRFAWPPPPKRSS